MTSWGAVAAERELPLPCDPLLPDAALLMMRKQLQTLATLAQGDRSG